MVFLKCFGFNTIEIGLGRADEAQKKPRKTNHPKESTVMWKNNLMYSISEHTSSLVEQTKRAEKIRDEVCDNDKQIVPCASNDVSNELKQAVENVASHMIIRELNRRMTELKTPLAATGKQQTAIGDLLGLAMVDTQPMVGPQPTADSVLE